MKRYFSLLLSALLLTSCNGWFFQPSGYNPPTPFLPPTHTPSIVTPTPGIVGVISPTPIFSTSTVAASTPAVVNTDTPIVLPTDILSPTATAPNLAVLVTVLGCNTSIDVSHGMGEVTNAFITLTNMGNMNLTNLKATLFALDEGRDHPDKTVDIPLLPVDQEVTLKLTVDSTYQAQTPIQVEVSADGGLFQRVGQDSCLDIGLFAPNPGSLNTPVAVNP